MGTRIVVVLFTTCVVYPCFGQSTRPSPSGSFTRPMEGAKVRSDGATGTWPDPVRALDYSNGDTLIPDYRPATTDRVRTTVTPAQYQSPLPGNSTSERPTQEQFVPVNSGQTESSSSNYEPTYIPPVQSGNSYPPAYDRETRGGNLTSTPDANADASKRPAYDDPYAYPAPSRDVTPSGSNPGTMYAPPTEPSTIPSWNNGTDSSTRELRSAPTTPALRAAPTLANPIGSRETTVNRESIPTTRANTERRDYPLTILLLFASIGLNIYLSWIAIDTYNRYQDLVSDMRATRARRERVDADRSVDADLEVGAY